MGKHSMQAPIVAEVVNIGVQQECQTGPVEVQLAAAMDAAKLVSGEIFVQPGESSEGQAYDRKVVLNGLYWLGALRRHDAQKPTPVTGQESYSPGRPDGSNPHWYQNPEAGWPAA